MIRKLFENQKPLMITGIVSLLCALILMIVAAFDQTLILGINRWIKPIKFFVSFVLFFWTLAVYLYFLKNHEKAQRRIAWATIAIFVVEMSIITLQAARGTTSHFNIATPLDSALFATMGVSILVNTLLIIYLLYLYFRGRIELPPSILWGMRFGLILFLAASFEGGYMSSQAGHSVGVHDGGAGLPLVNWSTEGGDLRVAHFIGMHALQAVPFFAYTLEKYNVKSATVWTIVFSVIYFAIFSFVFIQALLGQPLFGK